VLLVLPVPSTNLSHFGAVIRSWLQGPFVEARDSLIVSKRVRRWTHRTPSVAVCIAVSVGVGSDGIYDDDDDNEDGYVKVKFTPEQATKARRGVEI